MKRATILFLGPCRKFDPATSKPFPAFSSQSRSGKFLRSAIEAAAASDDVIIRFDNVIPRVLFDKEGRERYPSCGELVEELERHALWKLSRSDVVIGLSAIVGDALQRVEGSRLKAGHHAGPTVVRLEHPSFMMRRPIKERTDYVRRLRECICLAVDASIGSSAVALANA
ncbi:hypothetical protein HL666_30800 [Bradyrhizobium sp. 83002]|uniref:hypothetical protein n=1 Tax=Bradyrhizobium aeschynomenes TaxID=2734909 RepID=UPI00155714A1|nr:hypothetical protein [Bradyrhizobium aeschynomenes]NPU15166.1 hypothetical protein [Bradyrhizobium aeschynomenes]